MLGPSRAQHFQQGSGVGPIRASSAAHVPPSSNQHALGCGQLMNEFGDALRLCRFVESVEHERRAAQSTFIERTQNVCAAQASVRRDSLSQTVAIRRRQSSAVMPFSQMATVIDPRLGIVTGSAARPSRSWLRK